MAPFDFFLQRGHTILAIGNFSLYIAVGDGGNLYRDPSDPSK
jgi:hypothetical protein